MGDRFWIGWDLDRRSRRNARGRIVAPGLDEAFIAAFDVWDAGAYEEQWRQGIGRIVETGSEYSTLVTCVLRGRDGSFGGFQWPMYRDGETVVLQNQLIVRETVPGFDPADPYRTIEPRDPTEQVSEWRVPLESLSQFLLGD